MPKIENWSITKYPSNPYQAPELWQSALQGIVYGHPRIQDGERIATSTIQAINLKESWAETQSGTNYQLGEIDPKWVEFMNEKGYKLEDYINPILARALEAARNQPRN